MFFLFIKEILCEDNFFGVKEDGKLFDLSFIVMLSYVEF